MVSMKIMERDLSSISMFFLSAVLYVSRIIWRNSYQTCYISYHIVQCDFI